MITRTTTKFLSLLLSCVALGSDTQGTHKEQNLLFVRHARGRKLESGVQKNRSIKPKIRWKAKGLPDVWQGQHQVLEVQQAIIYSLKMLKKPGIRHFPGFFYTQNSVWTVRFWWNLNGNLWVYSGQITGGQAHFDLLWVKLLVDNRSKWSPILPSTDEHILDWFT